MPLESETGNETFPLVLISESQDFGRFLVAAEDIPPLTTIIRETPALLGSADCGEANDDNFPTVCCLGCCAKIPEDQVTNFCRQCQWPVCNEECEQIRTHQDSECSLLSSKPGLYDKLKRSCVLYKSVLVLRFLLLKSRSFDLWTDLVQFQDHNDVREGKINCMEKDTHILDNIAAFFGKSAPDGALKEQVLKISGILDVNAFTAVKTYQGRSTTIQCLFKTSSLVSHSCIPNSSWMLGNFPSFQMTIRSNVFIPKGTMITIPYSDKDNLYGTLQRLVSTEDTAHFSCKCDRCADATEVMTFVSAIRCFRCTNGYLLPLHPTNPDSDWICSWTLVESSMVRQGCLSSVPVSQVVLKICDIERRLDRIKNLYEDQHSYEALRKLESTRRAGETLFHKNHYLVQKCVFMQLKLRARKLDILDDDQLSFYVKDARYLLKIANVLNPGYSRYRSTLQFYLAMGLRQCIRRIITESATPKRDMSMFNVCEDSQYIIDTVGGAAVDHYSLLLEVKKLQDQVCKYFAYAQDPDGDTPTSGCYGVEENVHSPGRGRRFSAKTSFFQTLEQQRGEVNDAISQMAVTKSNS